MSDLTKLRCSKYLQSYIGDTYRRVESDLQSGRAVLFSGTPCQCAALHKYLSGYYERLYTVEVLCHGVPSPEVWSNYIQFRMKKAKTAKLPLECIFKTKDTSVKSSWNNSYIYMKFDTADYNVNSKRDPYMMLFARSDVILNASCYSCQYRKTVNRSYVDLSLGDCWNIRRINKSFDDDKGVSSVLVHSIKGKQLFEACADKLISFETIPETALQYSGSSHQPMMHMLDKKVTHALVKNWSSFGFIYYIYLPVLYKRKVFSKLKRLISR